MQHQGTKTIETEKLILRPLTLNDAQAIFSNYANDPNVTKFMTWPTHESIEDTRTILRTWIGQYDHSDFYQWCIVLKENGNDPIGTIGVVRVDENVEIIEIGYVIGKTWWHKGITSEALTALIKFFFDEVKVNRIQARHDPNNPNSGKVMKKCGMKFEGIMRKASRNNQGIVDSAIYAILSEDYFT